MIDQIHVLNYIMGREMKEGKRRRMERKKLGEEMRNRGAIEWFSERALEAYEETKCCVRVKGEDKREFLDRERCESGVSAKPNGA